MSKIFWASASFSAPLFSNLLLSFLWFHCFECLQVILSIGSNREFSFVTNLSWQNFSLRLLDFVLKFRRSTQISLDAISWVRMLCNNGCSNSTSAFGIATGFSFCLMYSITSRTNASEFSVAEILNSWPVQYLELKNNCICHWTLTTAMYSNRQWGFPKSCRWWNWQSYDRQTRSGHRILCRYSSHRGD